MKTASLRILAFLLACSGLQSPTVASETITYNYDSLGRLVQVARSGAPSAMTATYTYDSADNRTNVTVSASGSPSSPSFSIGGASVTEGGALVLSVTKSGSTTSSFNVNFATSNGTAIAGSDYYSASGTLSFAPAENNKTISVATIDDTVVESAETLTVTLSGATGGAAISSSQGVGTINDNDTAPPPPEICRDERGVIVPCDQPLTARKVGA